MAPAGIAAAKVSSSTVTIWLSSAPSYTGDPTG